MKVFDPKENGTRLPIKCWASQIEDGALEQARNLANLPISQVHVALMPDAHQGFGMCIGGVLFTDGAVVPNAVGVDIGCGVAMMNLGLTVEDLGDKLQPTLDIIAARVPTGFRQHATPMSEDDALREVGVQYTNAVQPEWWHKAIPSLGTLGGGNHFIEFQADDEGNVYVMLHSGSRGLGKMIGDHYHKLAVAMCHKWHTELPTDDLAFFPLGTPEWELYTSAMSFGLAFAEANRNHMLEEVKIAVMNSWPKADPEIMVNVHHNYAAWENHKGHNGIVHRKGAIRARLGETLLIPGSMGTYSYIGRGLGNPESFDTCQHGAGRAMGRKDAERRYAAGELENLATLMDRQGILMGGHASEAIDEHPGAYKPIEVVMADSADLVEPVTRLRPVAVVKG
jgi:tRNA-splicing ligase RtcB